MTDDSLTPNDNVWDSDIDAREHQTWQDNNVNEMDNNVHYIDRDGNWAEKPLQFFLEGDHEDPRGSVFVPLVAAVGLVLFIAIAILLAHTR